MTTNLVSVCALAFASVFILLSFLALAMHVITVVFPERQRFSDPVVVAAISTAVATLLPGARVTKIEEEP